MSASSALVFFGVRFEIVDEDEIEQLEERTHPHQRSARQASLDHYWANFDEPGERHYLFIGKQLGIVGLENEVEVSVASHELDQIRQDTLKKLGSEGLNDHDARMYVQLIADV